MHNEALWSFSLVCIVPGSISYYQWELHSSGTLTWPTHKKKFLIKRVLKLTPQKIIKLKKLLHLFERTNHLSQLPGIPPKRNFYLKNS